MQTDISENSQERIRSAYQEFWINNEHELGHYFRYLYSIFRFIHESAVENKKSYTNIVRAQISDNELQLLFYNCLYVHGIKRFKPLVEEYSLLNNLPVEHLLGADHKKFYDDRAYS
ncbi:MAG: putative phage abortive infection protein [Alphaproteobacteria bacterium]